MPCVKPRQENKLGRDIVACQPGGRHTHCQKSGGHEFGVTQSSVSIKSTGCLINTASGNLFTIIVTPIIFTL